MEILPTSFPSGSATNKLIQNPLLFPVQMPFHLICKSSCSPSNIKKGKTICDDTIL